jgi:hypothetical protein
MSKKADKKIQVNVEIQGDMVDRFMKFKDEEGMPTKASAGLKLIRLALAGIDKQSSEAAPASR